MANPTGHPNGHAYDVIIIGAGCIGAPTALFLSRAGFRTLVIDARSSPGQGSNKAAIGGIRATHSDPAKVRLCLRSLEIFSTWKDTLRRTISSGLKADTCSWHIARRRSKALKELLEVQHSLGLNIHWLEQDELLEVVPDLNPAGLLGGTYSPEDGNVSPLLFAARILPPRAALRRRVPLRRGGHRPGRRARAHRRGGATDRGRYSCENVLLAAGAWAQPLAQMVGHGPAGEPGSATKRRSPSRSRASWRR